MGATVTLPKPPPADSRILHGDPIWLASAVGSSIADHIGRLWYPELEICFLLRCLRRLGYDDAPTIRLRRNVNIIGRAGTGKSHNTLFFIREAMGAVDYADEDVASFGRPRYIAVDGGGVSWEKMRGGAVEGRLVMPKLHEVDFLYASELFSFLGSGERLQARMDTINAAIEEGNITVDQMGLMTAADDEKQLFAEKVHLSRSRGHEISYNARQGTIRFKMAASFICCTRPFDDRQLKLLTPSGFRSRFVEAVWAPTKDQLRAFLDGARFRGFSKERLRSIRDYNDYAWACTFKRVDVPPQAMLESLGHHFYSQYREISEETDIDIAEIIGERDNMDTLQLLTAFAVARILRDRRNRDIPPGPIERVDYTEADMESVKRFRQPRIEERRAAAMSKSTADSLRDQVTEKFTAFLRSRPDWSEGVWLGSCGFERARLVEHLRDSGVRIAGGKTVLGNRQTAYNHIAKMQAVGLLEMRDGLLHPTRRALALAEVKILDDDEPEWVESPASRADEAEPEPDGDRESPMEREARARGDFD